MRFLPPLFFLFLTSSLLAGQGPTLVVRQGDRSTPLQVEAVQARVTVHGVLAETELTLTFRNGQDRVLAGDLYVPLPEDTTVSGYALDIDGKMVDGVVVTKQKARVVFEKEVRKGIDPGVVEWTQGNTFKTRVFPIPAKGTRTVRVRYVSEITNVQGSPQYVLPLQIKGKVKTFAITATVLQARPRIKGWLEKMMAFDEKEGRYTTSYKEEDAALDQDFVLMLDETTEALTMVEESSDGHTYVATVQYPKALQDAPPARQPKRIALYWDASASRGKTDHAREIGLLQRYLFAEADGIEQVDLYVIRNTLSPVKQFALPAERDRLIQNLEGMVYDGGTQFGCLQAPAKETDFALLFSDGLHNFGRAKPVSFSTPVYVISSDTSTNPARLKAFARRTGGQYFDLKQCTEEVVLDGIGQSVLALKKAEAKGLAGIAPAPGTPVLDRFITVARLEAEEASLVLTFGTEGTTETVLFDESMAVPGEILRTYWAQKRLADLLLEPESNEKAITSLGKEYSIVTPGTSLIVLERLEQYLEHRMQPPRSLPKMRIQYAQRLAQIEESKIAKRDAKINQVLALWEKRIAWHDKSFSYPPDFRYSNGRESKRLRLTAANTEEALETDDTGEDYAVIAPEPPATVVVDGRAPVQFAAITESGPREREKSKAGHGDQAPGITLKPWNPKTPYLAALRAAAEDQRLAVYLTQRKEHGTAPAFFLDCAQFFLDKGNKPVAIRVLSNIAEMELENAALLRILAHRLAQIGELELAAALFKQVKSLRPEEPQSWRDLALVLGRLGQTREAVSLLNHVVMNRWDRFTEIEAIALMELNRLISKSGLSGDLPVDKRLIKNLDVDLRIVLTWDADLTDIDLWVTEPSGEVCMYNHNRTAIGGAMSRDFTQGYGPEEYLLKKGMNGTYEIRAHFYGSRSVYLAGAVTVQAEVFTNYGRPNEKRQSITLRLVDKKEKALVGKVEF